MKRRLGRAAGHSSSLPSLRAHLSGEGFICNACLARLPPTWSSFRTSQLARNLYIPPRNPRYRLPDSPARTRFAPSPTGYLHLGSLRTALFNYLLARSTGGQFLLRIEDTDQSRTIPDAEKRLYADLRWAGLQWDEGPEVGGPYGPYRQSERAAIYAEHADKLLSSGHAYRCFCSPAKLAALATERAKLGLPTDYDRTCADISSSESSGRAASGEPHVVRLRVPPVYPPVTDLIYGTVGSAGRAGGLIAQHAHDAWEDPILLKSDGLPTYHLANVVDDHLMRVTHVVRGAEWLPTTPKHLVLYKAFGWEPPKFAHVGLLTDAEGNKLSKRKMDINVASYRDKGVFPETLDNFVALLGWSHLRKSDVMTLEELVQNFSLKFTKGNTVVTPEKLHFLQTKHAIRRAEIGGVKFDEMVDGVVSVVEQEFKPEQYKSILEERPLRDYVVQVLRTNAKMYESARDFVRSCCYMFSNFTLAESALKDFADCAPLAERLEQVQLVEWDGTSLKTRINEIIESASPEQAERRVLNRRFWKYLRLVVADGQDGPSIVEVMVNLGREVTLKRIRAASSKMREEKEVGVSVNS
ncbi:hypothetical protein BDY21DRAFT_312925 [Lineolata rhizophorae]|uniref:Glutamate--tRNA ligase, mitochondrial n=1 Tax=Lineolata rhizophorae TaxID=578093 RepID=A0A6A6PDK7_9PEZI|nr:hypothetical protein BDY21DRAFT_312925 [Lineolata rhizophorae]